MTGRVHLWLALSLVSMTALAAGCGGGPKSETPAPTTAAVPVARPIDPTSVGDLTGKIVFEGTAPPPEPIRMTSDPSCLKAGNAGAVTESILVGSGGGLQNVFVYVKDGLGDHTFPAPATPVVLDQKGCHYTPHVLGIQVGQPLQIINSDPTLHNVHAIPSANQEFNAGQPITGMKMTHTFSTKEVMVPFKCDVHGWMRAWVGVVDHPYYFVTGADGAFQMKGLPAGTYTIEAWHEKLGTQTQMVTIGPKETKNVAFTFKT